MTPSIHQMLQNAIDQSTLIVSAIVIVIAFTIKSDVWFFVGGLMFGLSLFGMLTTESLRSTEVQQHSEVRR